MASDDPVVIPRKKWKPVSPKEASPDTPLWRIYHKDKEDVFTFAGKTRKVKFGRCTPFDSVEELKAFADFVEQHPDFGLIYGPEQDPINPGSIVALDDGRVAYTTKGIAIPQPHTHVARLHRIHTHLWVVQNPWQPCPPEYRHWLKKPLFADSLTQPEPASAGGIMSFSRTDPAFARQVIEKLLPDAGARRLVLELLVACIRENARQPKTWGLTLHANQMALNVGGGCYCVYVQMNKTALYFLPVPGDDALSTKPAFRTYPQVKEAWIAQKEIPTWLPRLGPGVLEFVRMVAAKNYLLPRKSREAHSPGVLRYIEEELGLEEPLPDPVYPATVPAANRQYWALQANPDIYDAEKAIAAQDRDTWRVDSSNVQVGDRLIIWKAKGSETTSGIVGLAEVIGEPEVRKPMNMQYFRRTFTEEELLKNRALLRYVRSDKLPAWKENLPAELHDLSVASGVQGNVFKVLPDQWEALMDFIGGWPEPEEEVVEPMPDAPLNLILYGPPGTGKTFSTIHRAVTIIEGEKPDTLERAKQVWEQRRAEGRIEFVTFHQSYGYEDFIEGIRPVMDDEVSDTPRYEVYDGILKTTALRALGASLETRPSGRGAQPLPFAQVWSYLREEVEGSEPKPLIIPSLNGQTAIAQITERGTIRSKHGASPLVTNREALAAVYARYAGEKERITIADVEAVPEAKGHSNYTAALYNYVMSRASEWRERMNDLPASGPHDAIDAARDYLTRRESSGYRLLPAHQRPRFVLVIDEINRGNISKVFGELITLIEDDKRIGGGLDFTVTLPHSRARFGLPSNLYLVGTMNTADKSIALVDVALRRRFEFEELMPDFSVCSGLEPQMRQVLDQLNRRIVLRKDRDHQIGHAFFFGVRNRDEFNRAFERKVIPLLQEYFYADWDALRFVLSEEDSKGRFILPISGSSDIKGARNRWQWYRDAGRGLDALDALRRNYNIGPGLAEAGDTDDLGEEDEPDYSAPV